MNDTIITKSKTIHAALTLDEKIALLDILDGVGESYLKRNIAEMRQWQEDAERVLFEVARRINLELAAGEIKPISGLVTEYLFTL